MSITLTKTKDGHPATRVGNLVYAMLPSRSPHRGTHQIFECFPPRNPATLSALDLRASAEFVEDEQAFLAFLQPLKAHQSELSKLRRQPIDGMIPTPWGASQSRLRYAEGIENVTTAGHGGFMLDPEQNDQVHECWRSDGGSYEEDEEWAIVALSFPDLFTSRELNFAHQTLKDSRPDEYHAVTGQKVLSSESRTLRRREFFAKHEGKLITYSAIHLKSDRSKTICSAAIGGRGDQMKLPQTSHFLVDSAEYNEGYLPYGFVIDEDRHQPCDSQGNLLATAN